MVVGPISDEERKADAELLRKFLHHTADDRTAAIVSACYVDKYLGELIRRALPGLNYDLRKKLFDPEGVLGPIAAKIDMAVALGVLDPSLQDWCIAIARIRNRFAHNLAITDFSHPEVAKLTEKLSVPEIYMASDSDEVRKKKHAELNKTAGRDRFLLVAFILQIFIDNIVAPRNSSEHSPKN